MSGLTGWDQGTLLAARLNAQQGGGDNSELIRQNTKLFNEREDLIKDWNEIAPHVGILKGTLERKIKSPSQMDFDIYASMRPDLKDPDTMSLKEKRVHNLYLLAWHEYWTELTSGDEVDVDYSQKAKRVSEMLSEAVADKDMSPAQVEHNQKVAIKALDILSTRLAVSKMTADPNEWVDNRVKEMVGLILDPRFPEAKFKDHNYAKPECAPLIKSSKCDAYKKIAENWEKRHGKRFDPFESNIFGLKAMSFDYIVPDMLHQHGISGMGS